MAVCPLSDQRLRLITTNRHEYGDVYADLPFLTPDQEVLATARRSELIAALGGRVAFGCGGSKLDMRNLSPGCRICVEGSWSCLFINGRCNARCFYCPGRQDETGLPTTNSVTFRTPADYVAYLGEFGFRGMSLSGGEPLLTPGRSLAFLAAAKRQYGDALHTWLYTNGTLVDREILLRLRDAGLDEIRFDIGAVGYALEKAAMAVGLLPTVTVEIPAVPEDLDLLKEKMSEMCALGVKHLNLHQLRLTPYSHHRFSGRPYTYLHGDRVTVLESELVALELIRHGLDQQLDLPVNYCSFVYKNRYQKAAARQRSALALRKPYEVLTSAGYVRTLALYGPLEALEGLTTKLASAGHDEALWLLQPARQRLLLAPAFWSEIDLSGFTPIVGYAECGIREQVSYRNPFREVRLPSGRKIAVERWAKEEFELTREDLNLLLAADARSAGGAETVRPVHGTGGWQDYEVIAEGLQDYF